jgi:hypothetical protein
MGQCWTFGSLIASEMRVTAVCLNSRCNHIQRLDLLALAARLGSDTPATHDDLVPRLKCLKCGGREIGLTYTPDWGQPGNPYMKARDGQ